MPDVFISYTHADRDIARCFADALRQTGLGVWWDTTIRPGETYDIATERALKEARAVVVLWSAKSAQSRWVRSEATLADRSGTLLPALIEPCERPIMFELIQTANLAHWQGEPHDPAWLAFLADVEHMVKRVRPLQTPEPKVEQPDLAPDLPPPSLLRPGKTGGAPTLAVLPFTNRSALADDDVFADGMVEDLISALAQGVGVRVLGSASTAALRRGAFTEVAAVGRQLGVRYLLEGNVRRVGDILRVTTQLLEASTGTVVWTGRFDKPLAQLAELQEELVLDVAAQLDVEVVRLEMDRALKKPDDLSAWEAIMRSMSALRQLDGASLELAVAEAQRAVAIAPDYGEALAMHAYVSALRFFEIGAEDPVELTRIRGLAERSLAIAPDEARVLTLAGLALSLAGWPKEALHHLERSITKTPADGVAHATLGFCHTMLNHTDQALASYRMAIRLMPTSPLRYMHHAMCAVILMRERRWSEAEAAIDTALDANPGYAYNLVLKAILLRRQHRDAEGCTFIDRVRKAGLSLADVEPGTRHSFAGSDVLDEMLDDLHSLWARACGGL